MGQKFWVLSLKSPKTKNPENFIENRPFSGMKKLVRFNLFPEAVEEMKPWKLMLIIPTDDLQTLCLYRGSVEVFGEVRDSYFDEGSS